MLQEFSDLEVPARDFYRYVAALQAMGAKVHRQLVIRVLGVEPGAALALLGAMEGVVDEYDTAPREGLYGWETRHDVIAKVIATYKFADQRELYSLLDRLIEDLNPTMHIEREIANAIAANNMGIGRLTDAGQQAALLRKLIAVVPGERTPRRRLIRLFLHDGNLEEAERSIHVAKQDLRADSIVDRYEAVLALRRAEEVEGLLEEDWYAMLLQAENLARQCVVRHPYDRYNYRVLSDVGKAVAMRFSDLSLIDQAIEMMRQAEVDIPDPDFARERRALETSRRALAARAAAQSASGTEEVGAREALLVDSES